MSLAEQAGFGNLEDRFSHVETHISPCKMFFLFIFSIVMVCIIVSTTIPLCKYTFTVLPAKSDSDIMFCLQSYQGLRIDRSLVY